MCETAKSAVTTQRTIALTSKYWMLGLRLLHAKHNEISRDPKPKAEEMKPNPSAPTLSTFVAKSGNTTLKLIPNSETMPMTVIIKKMDGVWTTYASPSRRLCMVLCLGAHAP